MQFSNKELISNFYDQESSMHVGESLFAKVTLQGQVEDIAMLNAIVERFGATRFELSRTIIHNAVLEMFHALSPSDQAALSVKADAEITDHMKKAGFKEFFQYGAAGTFENESGHWREYSARVAAHVSEVSPE